MEQGPAGKYRENCILLSGARKGKAFQEMSSNGPYSQCTQTGWAETK